MNPFSQPTEILDLSQNDLGGKIPSQVGLLTELRK